MNLDSGISLRCAIAISIPALSLSREYNFIRVVYIPLLYDIEMDSDIDVKICVEKIVSKD